MDMHKMPPWDWLRQESSRKRPFPSGSHIPPLLRWEREFDNWFEQMLGDMAWTTPAPHAEPSIPFRPNLDILERDDHYLITAELPGVDKQDLHITLDQDALTIPRHEHHGQGSKTIEIH